MTLYAHNPYTTRQILTNIGRSGPSYWRNTIRVSGPQTTYDKVSRRSRQKEAVVSYLRLVLSGSWLIVAQMDGAM